MNHPYEYGDWAEDALADLAYIQQYAATCYNLLSMGRELPKGYLIRMSDLAQKVERQFTMVPDGEEDRAG